ncbi:MAG: hypothetical protein WD872_14975, partial [Pirellulaceae bacterium]
GQLNWKFHSEETYKRNPYISTSRGANSTLHFSFHERNFDSKALAKILCRLVQRQLGDANPQVQLVARSTAFEAAKRVLAHIR